MIGKAGFPSTSHLSPIPYPPSPAWGFTLIELAIVSAVIAILLVTVVPRFQQTMLRLRAEQTAFELAHLLRYAHERAISSGQETVWGWDEAQRRAQLYAITRAPNQPPSVQPLRGREASSERLNAPSVSLEFAPGDSASPCPPEVAVGSGCVRFFPDGTSEAMTITMRAPGYTCRVTVDETTSRVLLVEGPPAR